MNYKTVLAMVLGAAAMVNQAGAVQINGTIDFSSIPGKEASLVGGANFLTATGLDFPVGVNADVDGATVDFSGELNLTATLNDINPFGAAVNPVWATADGRFTFNLAPGAAIFRGAHFLTVDGVGTAHDTTGVLDDTPGTFTLTTQGKPEAGITKFSWSATSDTNPNRTVPDGGATAILLGAGLLGLGACSMRKSS